MKIYVIHICNAAHKKIVWICKLCILGTCNKKKNQVHFVYFFSRFQLKLYSFIKHNIRVCTTKVPIYTKPYRYINLRNSHYMQVLYTFAEVSFHFIVSHFFSTALQDVDILFKVRHLFFYLKYLLKIYYTL